LRFHLGFQHLDMLFVRNDVRNSPAQLLQLFELLGIGVVEYLSRVFGCVQCRVSLHIENIL